MVQSMEAERLFKAKAVALIGMYFGEDAAVLYKATFETLPLEFVEKTAEKLLTDYLGNERARAVINELKEHSI